MAKFKLMAKKEPRTSVYVVRYPKINVILALSFLGIPVIGFYMAINGQGHWTFWQVGNFAAFGIWFLAYLLMYRTVFTADAVEQRAFPGIVRRLWYCEIRQVKWVNAGRGHALALLSADGKKIKVFGAQKQLDEAQEILFEKIPHAFNIPAATMMPDA